VIRGTIRDDYARKPGPADMPLVIEVADASIDEDRRHITRFAWAGIPVARIVNLRKRTGEVHTDPNGPGDPALCHRPHDGRGGVGPGRRRRPRLRRDPGSRPVALTAGLGPRSPNHD